MHLRTGLGLVLVEAVLVATGLVTESDSQRRVFGADTFFCEKLAGAVIVEWWSLRWNDKAKMFYGRIHASLHDELQIYRLEREAMRQLASM